MLGWRVEAHARSPEVSWSRAPARPSKELPNGSLERVPWGWAGPLLALMLGVGPRLSARRIGAVALLAVCCASAEPAAAPRSVLVAWPPEPEVRAALRYVMTELRRLSNRFRYASLTTCHRAEAAEVDGERSLFLDVEFDMLRGQPSRHNVILFKDGDGAVTSMALDEFPHVELREPPDPDV